MEISITSLFIYFIKLFCIGYFSLIWFFMLYFTDEPNFKPGIIRHIVFILPILLFIDALFIGFIKWTI